MDLKFYNVFKKILTQKLLFQNIIKIKCIPKFSKQLNFLTYLLLSIYKKLFLSNSHQIKHGHYVQGMIANKSKKMKKNNVKIC